MKIFNVRKRRKDGPEHRIFKPKRIRTPRYRARRIVIYGTAVVTILFLTKLFVGLFDIEHVHVIINLTGNSHYTEGHIYDVLGDNLQNIITDSESKTETYLKDNLSYVKDAYVSKKYVKRQLSVEITERKPFARVKYIQSPDEKSKDAQNKPKGRQKTDSFYLIDEAGYVLESIAPEGFTHMILIYDEGIQLPEVGQQIKSGTTHRGIQILKLVINRKSELRKNLRSIDARISDKIIIDLVDLPMPVWIASDMLKTGLDNVSVFIQQQGLFILQQKKNNLTNKNRMGKKVKPLLKKYTYLDSRYKDTLFIGGDSR